MITPVKQWRRKKQVANLIGKKGKIILWTIIRVPSKTFMDQAPYPVVIVEFKDRSRTILQLVDWEESDLTEDREIICVLRKNNSEDKTGIIPYTIKARPL